MNYFAADTIPRPVEAQTARSDSTTTRRTISFLTEKTASSRHPHRQ